MSRKCPNFVLIFLGETFSSPVPPQVYRVAPFPPLPFGDGLMVVLRLLLDDVKLWAVGCFDWALPPPIQGERTKKTKKARTPSRAPFPFPLQFSIPFGCLYELDDSSATGGTQLSALPLHSRVYQ